MKMRTISKMLAVVAFATLFTTNVTAQSVKYPKIHFGMRLGGTFNSTSVSGADIKGESKAMVTGGFNFDFQVASIPLYMETGIYAVDRSGRFKNAYDEVNVNVEVPLLLSYHHYIADKVAIQPFAGPFVSQGKETSYGARIGCGINYGRLYANVGYDLDMAKKDIDKDGRKYGEYKSSGLFMTIGYNFCGRR